MRFLDIPRVRAAAAVLAGASMLLAACFYWQSLADLSTPVRRTIPNSEITAEAGAAAAWPLPVELRSSRPHRTAARLWEDGALLSLRVEEKELVANQPLGRFFVGAQTLWFSSSDGSSPRRNRRRYELELFRPNHHPALGALAAFVVSLAAFALALPWKQWRARCAAGFTARSLFLGRPRRVAGLLCLGVAAASMSQCLPGLALVRHLPLAPGAFFAAPDGTYSYYLPRWVHSSPTREAGAKLLENRIPLERITVADTARAGTYMLASGRVRFRSSDGVSPTLNSPHYELAIPYWPRPVALLWTLGLGLAGIFLFTRASAWNRGLWKYFPSGRACWWFAVALISLGKLWVVAADEPIGQLADGWVYAQTAAGRVWGPGMNLPSHPPGFPFLAMLTGQLGLPWRVALELLYLAACLLAAHAVAALTRSRVTALVVFALLAWQPWTFSGFREFMSDPVVTVLVMALLGAMCGSLCRPAKEWKPGPFLAIGGFLFLWWWARREEPLLYGSYLLFAVLCVAGPIRKGVARWERRTVILLLLPLLITAGLSLGIKTVNYYRFGVYAKCQLDEPGLLKVLQTLYQVKPERPLRYAPVTRQSLRAACEQSPTLKPYAAELLNTNLGAILLGEESTRVPGEFGPMLDFLLLQTLPGPAAEQNALMTQAAAEINEALRQKRLPARRGWYPLDPNWSVWLPDWPSSFLDHLSEGAGQQLEPEPWGSYHKAVVQHFFDQGANRRADNIYPRLLLAEGRVSAPPGRIDSAALTDEQGHWLAAARLSSSNFWDRGASFDFRLPLEEDTDRFHLLLLHGQQTVFTSEFSFPPTVASSALTEQLRPVWAKASGTNVVLGETGDLFTFDFRALKNASLVNARRQTVERYLGMVFATALKCGVLLVFVCALFAGKSRLFRPAVLCLVLAAGWFAARAALYALLDINRGFEPATRFMRCVSPVYVLILLLAAMGLGLGLRRWLLARCRQSARALAAATRALPEKMLSRA